MTDHNGPEQVITLAGMRTLCPAEVSDLNDSSEHVIPNALGGRLRVRGFLCRCCNAKTGCEWDAALAKQLNAFCVLLGVVRERGDVPDEPIQQASGRELLLQADGMMKPRHPKVSVAGEPREGQTLEVSVEARTLEEAGRISKELEASYAKKGGRVESCVIDDRYTYDLDDTKIPMSIGGGGASYSIVKTALSFAHHCGISWEACEQALSCFNSENQACFGYYCQRDDVIARDNFGPYHCLVLRGCPSSGLLLCYVEFFSVYRMVVCLSKRYTGEGICRTYGIDPLSGQEVGVSMDFDFRAVSIEDLYSGRLLDLDLMKDAIARLMPMIERRSLDLAHGRELEQAIEYAHERTKAELGAGYREGMIDTKYVYEKMLPFYEFLVRRRRARKA